MLPNVNKGSALNEKSQKLTKDDWELKIKIGNHYNMILGNHREFLLRSEQSGAPGQRLTKDGRKGTMEKHLTEPQNSWRIKGIVDQVCQHQI